MPYPYYNNYVNQYPQQQSYYPATYQPMVQPQMQQQIAQAPQNVSYSPAINQSGIIWISGLQEAQMYPIAPNNAVALWAKDGKTIYLKQADATGKPTMTVYDLVERKEAPQESVDNGQSNSVSYATKDDLAAVVGVVKGFDDVLGTLKNDVDAMKGDLWGIAGKKKATKKTTTEDPDE